MGKDGKTIYLFSTTQTVFLGDTVVSSFTVFVISGKNFQFLVTGWYIALVFRVSLSFHFCLGSKGISLKVRRYIRDYWQDFILT